MYITVNNHKWELLFVNPNDERLVRSDGAYTLGVTDNISKTVVINNRLSEYMTTKVLSHELTHVYSFEYDYKMDMKTEEIVADFISLYGKSIVFMTSDIMEIIRRIAV